MTGNDQTHLKSKYWGILSTLTAIFLLAGNGYFAKGLMTGVLTLTMLRAFIAAFAILLLTRLRKENIALRNRRDYAVSIVLGLLLGLHWLSYFYAMKISTVTLGMTALYTYPVITLFLERMFFKQALGTADILTTIVLFLGVALMGAANHDTQSNNVLGLAFGLFSAFCFACRNILQHRLFSSYPAHHSIYYQTITIGIVLLAVSIFCDASSNVVMSLSHEWYLWLLLGIFFTALPHSLMTYGITRVGARSVSIIGCIQPVMGSILAFILLNETASLQVTLGAATVLACSYIEISKLTTRSEVKS